MISLKKDKLQEVFTFNNLSFKHSGKRPTEPFMSYQNTDNYIHVNVIYPALLTQVARAFKSRIHLSTCTKNSLEYQNCFIGKDAVVCLNMNCFLSFFNCYIIHRISFYILSILQIVIWLYF